MKAAMVPRSRLTYLTAALAVIAAGLLWRWPALGLPWPIAKIGGSILWGTMVYALVRSAHPPARLTTSTFVACAIAVAVEMFRLVHTPWLDQFRLTLAGQLLLGRVFSLWNLVSYATGIAAAAGLDRHLTGRRRI